MTFQFEHPDADVIVTVFTDNTSLLKIAYTSTRFADVIEDVAEYCGIERSASEFSEQLSAQMMACAKIMHADLHFFPPAKAGDELTHTLVFHDISADNTDVKSISDCVDEYLDMYLDLIHLILQSAKDQIRSSLC